MGKLRRTTSGQGSQAATTHTTKTGRATAKDAGANKERGDGKGNHTEGDILRATLGPLKSKSKNSKKSKPKPKMTPEELLRRAEELLSTGRPDEALQNASRAMPSIQPHGSAPTLASLKPFSLIGLIYYYLGNADMSREYFLKAVELDPDGSIPESEGGGPEKFLWLAQLSEEGGHDSVRWFQRGATVLRNANVPLGDVKADMENRTRLAAVLCSLSEVYMTDLSWEEDAETKCESYVTEALLIAPDWPEPLQTLASIRISQNRIEEARKALMDSMDLWKDLLQADGGVADFPGVPDFSARISLARLLMEVEAEEEALVVVKRLVQEDDQSVEAWYLGGWCLYLIGQKRRKVSEDAVMHDETQEQEKEAEYYQSSLIGSREWLKACLRLYDRLDYQDFKLRDHAQELVAELDKTFADADIDKVHERGGYDNDANVHETSGDDDEANDDDYRSDQVDEMEDD